MAAYFAVAIIIGFVVGLPIAVDLVLKVVRSGGRRALDAARDRSMRP